MVREGSRSFYEIAGQLDELAMLQKPSSARVAQVLELVREEAHARYFFRAVAELGNVGWLAPLDSARVFDEPPDAIPVGEGMFRVPSWPASRYLARIGDKRPGEVLRIAHRIRTDNFNVILDLLDACLQMTPHDAAQIVPKVDEWIDSPYSSLIPAKVGDLLSHLVTGEEWEPALDLVRILTRPVLPPGPSEDVERQQASREVVSRFDRWDFNNIMRNQVHTLAVIKPREVLCILEAQLRGAIGMEGHDSIDDDGSCLWRPAIEDHDQNWGLEGMKDVLTVGLRDALERAMSDAPEQVEPIIERYLGDSFSVFRRLALHLVRLGRQHYQKLVLKVFDGREVLDDIAVHHEFSLLMRECFQELPEDSKIAFLDMIVGEPPSEEEGKTRLDELHRRHWVLRRLWLVREHLMPPYDSLYTYLVDRFSEPEHPEFLAWHGPVWVGPTSPKDRSELVRMSAREVLEYLWAFVPSGDAFDDSREGLARQLEAVVRDEPEDYVAIAPDFVSRGVHPTYVYHLVRGFHEAWKDDKELDWERVLALCEPISLALTDAAVSLVRAELEIGEIGWSAVRAAIARFFAGALQRDDRPLPMEMMPRIRDILLGFMWDSEPRPEDERKHAEGALDWVTLRINSTRGVAADALLEYALRHARLHKEEYEAGKDTGAHPCRLEPEMKAAFNNMLDKSKELSAAVHSIFGQCLPNFLYLDRDWTIANLDAIFPSDPDKALYWKAAWEAYMLYCGRMYTEIYKLLRPQYWRAVQAMARSEVSKVIKRTEHRLAYHLALAYKVGLEILAAVSGERPMGFAKPETEGSLLDAFLASASDEVRATLVRGLGSELRPDKAVEDKDWQCLREYWEARTLAAQAAPSERPFDQELSAFSSWLEGVPEGLDELAPLLEHTIDHLTQGHEAHEVLTYLSKQSNQHPALAVNFLRRLLERQQTQDQIYLFGVEVQVGAILQNALPSDETGRREAISIINMLGERGEYGYRDLLTNSAVR